MSSEVVWSLPKRVAFRFGFILAVLYAYPAPLGYVPKTEKLAEWLNKPFEWLIVWFAETFFGQTPPQQPTGSGDTLMGWTTFVVILLLAAIGAAVWSALDRKRLAYPRLALGTWIGLRYLLAFTLYGYGFAKIFPPSQFPPPGPLRLDERVGDMSPMGMLWTFQGASQAYTLFGGLCELLAGTLLLWRRTATIGALVAMGVMTNVVMLNFCYDVPVKLFSAQLLIIAAVIAMPQLRRVTLALLGYAAPEVPLRVRSSARMERARLVVKLGVFALLAYNVYRMHDMQAEYARPKHELHGTWKVETMTVDGVDKPPLTTDKERWCKVMFTEWGLWTKTCDDTGGPMMAELLPIGRSIIVTNPRDQSTTLWRFQHTGDQLVLDAVQAGKRVHVVAKRVPDPLLVTRGFHWVQELPFNR